MVIFKLCFGKVIGFFKIMKNFFRFLGRKKRLVINFLIVIYKVKELRNRFKVYEINIMMNFIILKKKFIW